jgi:hypothetical protein
MAAIIALIAVVGSAAAAGSPTTVSCTLKLTDQSPPTARSGADFGFVNCGKPFGSGVQTDTFKETFASKTSGSVTGPYKEYFDTGTVQGTYTLAITVTGKTSATFKGTAKYTGGTGAFSHAAGSGTLSCSSADGVHTTCTAKATFTSV